MSKYTPGPWFTTGAANQHVRTNGTDSEFRLYKINHKGDAALIAAAPEMLEALKRAQSHICADRLECGAVYDQVFAAIAKAEGGK